MSKFEVAKPETNKKQVSVAISLNPDAGKKFKMICKKLPISPGKLARQMIEHCLKDLEEEE